LRRKLAELEREPVKGKGESCTSEEKKNAVKLGVRSKMALVWLSTAHQHQRGR